MIEQFCQANGQILLPIVELIQSASQVVETVIHEIGRQTLEVILRLSAEQVAGPRTPGKASGEADLSGCSGPLFAPRLSGQGEVHRLPPGVLLRHQGLPEIIVEVFVQEGAVHVQEHPGYVVPGKSHLNSFLDQVADSIYRIID